MRMTVFGGWLRETAIEEAEIIDRGAGAGEIVCLECGGDGDWTKFQPEPKILAKPLKCGGCKGTGRILAQSDVSRARRATGGVILFCFKSDQRAAAARLPANAVH